MIAAAICDEDIEVAGIIYDSGPVGVSRPQEEARSPSTLESIKMSVRLAAKVPQLYTDRVLHRLGVTRFDEYSRLQRTEGPLMREAERCGGRQLGSYCSKRWRRFPLLDEVATRCGAPFHEVSNINSEHATHVLQQMRPDLLVSLGNRILKPHTLTIPKVGTLNGHSSLLPRYRGTTAEFWQLAFGEKLTGVTIHWMAPGLDSGPILVQSEWPIEAGVNHLQLRILSQFRRIEAWQQAIRLAARGVAGSPQAQSDTPTFRRPQLSHLYEYYVLGRPPTLHPAR